MAKDNGFFDALPSAHLFPVPYLLAGVPKGFPHECRLYKGPKLLVE
jgi:hypothetical protein